MNVNTEPKGRKCFWSPQTILHEIQMKLAGACKDLNCLRSPKHVYTVKKKYIEGLCMWKTNTKRCGNTVRKGHVITYRGQWASKQETANNTEPTQVNCPVRTGYTAFWSLLQRFDYLSLSRSLFTTEAILVNGRTSRSVVQMWTPCLDCFIARCSLSGSRICS